MIGKTISHYKILEKLGGGGMGVVYKAEDTKLHRTVALKFLPSELIHDEEAKKRFIQEAHAASSLDHNNICVVHEIDETDDGQIFISMNCYDGETLKKKIERGPIKTDEAIDIAVQIANGLKKAHEQKIIHRDIKPANIFITDDGVVKILDFGLAKLSGQTMMTKMGSTMGTVAYMSPEQTLGENVNHRTDIWSLGVVFYEMLTGKLPFMGEYEQAIVYSILNEQPNAIDLILKDIPKQMIDITEKSMEKNVARRYQNIIEVIKELEDAKSGSFRSKKEKSILVLPFDDISQEKDNEYFSDGLTEEIITDLSHIQDLLVISRSSAMTFKGTKRSIPEIAKSVNVKYVLEGSVRKAGNSLRIIAQLIDATNDVHLWAEKYSGTMDDIFDIQEKVSRKIVEALKGRITPEDGQQLSSRPSVTDIGVYEAYARARFEFWKMDPGCNEKALHILEEAIIAYGEHPLLLSGIGAIHWQFYHMLGDLDDAHLKKIEECTVKLFAADPASSYGHRLTSYLCMLAGQTPVAIDHLRQAMNADPNDTETLLWLSYLLASHAGRPLIAKPVADRWLAIDPLNPFSSASSMWVHWASGDLVNALKSVEEWCLRDPGNRIGAWYRCQLLAWVGRYEESYRLADALTKEDPNEVMGQILRCLILALQGRKDEAFHTVSEENLAHAWIDFGLPCIMAECYALMEEKDEALRWLERAVEKGLFNYPSINEFDPFLSNIRYEERFKKLMERVKYKWENFEV